MAPGEQEDTENIFNINISEVGARGVSTTGGAGRGDGNKPSPPVNIDNSQENADFIKFRQLDMQDYSDIYELFDRVGVDYSSPDGPQQIVDFANSHPWVYALGAEEAWIINDARKKVSSKKTS